MPKLSDAKMNALTQVHNGETLTARQNTVDSLVRDDYLAMYTTGYVLTDKAYELGFSRPSETSTTVDEIEALPAPLADWEIELTRAVMEMFPAKWSTSDVIADNVKVWNNLSIAEIRADIKTAVPIGRAGKRLAAKHNH